MRARFEEFMGGASASVFVVVAIVTVALAVVTHDESPWVGLLAPWAVAAVVMLLILSTGMGRRSEDPHGRKH